MESNGQPSQLDLSHFNSYVAEFRARADNFIKHVLLISGGIQAITIGAFLNGKSFVPPPGSVPLLREGWVFLSSSIVLCLTFLFFQTVAQWHVTLKQVRKIRAQTPGVEIMNTWPLFRAIIWVVGVSAFISCVAGVVIISKAAIALI